MGQCIVRHKIRLYCHENNPFIQTELGVCIYQNKPGLQEQMINENKLILDELCRRHDKRRYHFDAFYPIGIRLQGKQIDFCFFF